MGEIAEMMLDGVLCEGCGAAMPGGADGYPRRCRDCKRSDPELQSHPPVKPGSPMTACNLSVGTFILSPTCASARRAPCSKRPICSIFSRFQGVFQAWGLEISCGTDSKSSHTI